MIAARASLATVACIPFMWVPLAHAQRVIRVTPAVASDVPTDVRTPFALDARERRPIAMPGPPVGTAEAESLGCRSLPNGWVVCPPGTSAMRGIRAIRSRPGLIAMQESLPPSPEDPPPPAQPASPPSSPPPPAFAPGRVRVPPPVVAPQYAAPQYASPQFAAPQYAAPQFASPQFASPQFAVPQYAAPQYAAPQYASPQSATYDWSPDGVDRLTIEWSRPSGPVRSAGGWGGGDVPTPRVSSPAWFASCPCSLPDFRPHGLVRSVGGRGPVATSGMFVARSFYPSGDPPSWGGCR